MELTKNGIKRSNSLREISFRTKGTSFSSPQLARVRYQNPQLSLKLRAKGPFGVAVLRSYQC
jgi:hypothetical protein